MLILGGLVATLGAVLGLVAWVWFMILGFRRSVVWGLVALVLPPVYGICHLRESLKPLGLYLLGAGVGFGGAALALATAEGGDESVQLFHYLLVSAVVFGLGIMVVITRRNAIAVLMGIELLLNAAGLNFVAFSKYSAPGSIDGQVVTLFVIVIAAAEVALALAIVLNIFNNLNTVHVDEARTLKG